MDFEFLPDRIAALERDERGYPVPFIVMRDDAGRPQFAGNDVLRIAQAVQENRCHICGQDLDPADTWFVGGEGSALLNGGVGAFNDGPMHGDCMRFAVRYCPHLAQRMVRPVGPSKAPAMRAAGYIVRDTTTIPGVPPITVAVQTVLGFKWSGGVGGTFTVPKPYRRVEYWQHGELLPLDRGRKLAKRLAGELARDLGMARR
jgi:hypothetical protein